MPPTLKANQIHIHTILLTSSADTSADLGILSPAERERLGRFKFDHLKKRFLIRQTALRLLLANYLNVDTTDIRFGYGQHGKPYLLPVNPAHKVFTFNVSDSDDVAVMAFAQGHELGIDIEKIRHIDDLDSLVSRNFTEKEIEVYAHTSSDKKTEVFFNAWTAKEAYMKAKGEGLSLDLKSFSVACKTDKQPCLIEVPKDPEEVLRWSFHRFVPQTGYIATLVCPALDFEIVYFGT